MHTFERLDEFIKNIVEIHAKAANLYSNIQGKTESQRLRMLLDDMVEKEHRLKKLTGEFLAQSDEGTRTTYMQYSLEESFDDLTKPWASKPAPLQLEDITSLGLTVHKYQVDLLENALREISSTHAEGLIKDLLQLEKAEQRSFTQEIMSSYEL